MNLNRNDNDPQALMEPEAPLSPRVLPILPVSELVLFPRIIMPLALWEESAQLLVNEVLLQDKTVGILAAREAKAEGYGPDNLYQVGTAAVILKMRKPEDDSVRLLIQGLYRFKVENWVGLEPYLTAQVTPIAEEYEPDQRWKPWSPMLKGSF